MAFIKYFLGLEREKLIGFLLILFVSVHGLIKGGGDKQSLIGIAVGALFIWAIFKINNGGHLFILLCVFLLLTGMMFAGYLLQAVYQNYYSGFLLGGILVYLLKEYEAFRKLP
ncbi:hypothetical protein J7S78_14125 [Klebsiella oxytoca]|uniref:Uncharacterized protein n=1 Tax=Klebsiella oxytoca TaxID=571 RepID=A0AAP2BIP6_KLEOX|nr:hypothetical protein [Klebsiella oxytoca]MBQ0600932.1 hypothetical protein [Klebsiella oxytoca]